MSVEDNIARLRAIDAAEKIAHAEQLRVVERDAFLFGFRLWALVGAAISSLLAMWVLR